MKRKNGSTISCLVSMSLAMFAGIVLLSAVASAQTDIVTLPNGNIQYTSPDSTYGEVGKVVTVTKRDRRVIKVSYYDPCGIERENNSFIPAVGPPINTKEGQIENFFDAKGKMILTILSVDGGAGDIFKTPNPDPTKPFDYIDKAKAEEIIKQNKPIRPTTCKPPDTGTPPPPPPPEDEVPLVGNLHETPTPKPTPEDRLIPGTDLVLRIPPLLRPTPTPTPTPTPDPKLRPVNFDPSTLTGLVTLEIKTDQGHVNVSLPADMRAGDTISGTIIPSGSDDQNSGKLTGAVLEVDGKRTPIVDRVLRFVIPTTGVLKLLLKDKDGKTIGHGDLPDVPKPTIDTPPTDYGVSPIAQNGRPLIITGRFDGDLINNRTTLGGQPVKVIAESPRSTIISVPATATTGPTKIVAAEAGRTMKPVSLITNVVRLEMTAPKTSLAKGESTEVNVRVTGLQGIANPGAIRLLIENRSADVIKFKSTGENRIFKPVFSAGSKSAIADKDEFLTTEHITALRAGGFTLTATIFMADHY